MFAEISTDVRADGVSVVTVTGEVDISCADALEVALMKATDAGNTVADLRGVTFIGSTGLNLLVGAYNRATTDGRWVRLVFTGNPLEKLLKIAGLDGVFAAYADLDSALAA